MKRQRKLLVLTFNLVSLAIFSSLLMPVLSADGFQLFPEVYGAANTELIGSFSFRLAGRFAVRFLALSLAISPTVYFTGRRQLIPLRKWAGLWAFGFAALHFTLFFSDVVWRKIWGDAFVFGGLAALIILTLLALSSHRPAMRLLGRNWKRLHRLVYAAGALVVLHNISGLLHWKESPDFDIALAEAQILGLLIGLLLLLRIPSLKLRLRNLLRQPKRKRAKAKVR